MRYIDFEDKWGDYLNEVIVKLLRKKGHEKFGLVFETAESEDHPPGIHGPCLFVLIESSGKARYVTNHWDPEEIAPDGSKGYYRLHLEREWSDVSIQCERERNESFLRAFRDAGLSLTKEEERRLENYLYKL